MCLWDVFADMSRRVNHLGALSLSLIYIQKLLQKPNIVGSCGFYYPCLCYFVLHCCGIKKKNSQKVVLVSVKIKNT